MLGLPYDVQRLFSGIPVRQTMPSTARQTSSEGDVYDANGIVVSYDVVRHSKIK